MMAPDIFRDRRAGMIAGAVLLHLSALGGAWALMPPGTETRLNRPIEASFAPAPSSDAVNMNSAPLAPEVVSDNTSVDATALEDSAPVAPPDALKAETVPADSGQDTKPDGLAIQVGAPSALPVVPPERATPETPSETAVAEQVSPAAMATTAPQQVAVLAPDVLTSANTPDSSSVPLVQPPSEPARELPDRPMPPAVEKVRPVKPEKPRPAHPVKKNAEPPVKPSQPVKAGAAASRFASLEGPLRIKRAQQGGAGSISDIGTSNDARASGATMKQYGALIVAQARSHIRYPAGAKERGIAGTARVGFVVMGQGAMGSVHIVASSGDAALDAAAVSLVRGLSLPPPPGGRFASSIPITYRQLD